LAVTAKDDIRLKRFELAARWAQPQERMHCQPFIA